MSRTDQQQASSRASKAHGGDFEQFRSRKGSQRSIAASSENAEARGLSLARGSVGQAGELLFVLMSLGRVFSVAGT